MNSPQQQRKAPQTARGFNHEHRGDALHVPMPPHPSAQADIAYSQPRIHSPRLADASSPSDPCLDAGLYPARASSPSDPRLDAGLCLAGAR
jgi:hypothetical protein